MSRMMLYFVKELAAYARVFLHLADTTGGKLPSRMTKKENPRRANDRGFQKI